MIKNISFVFLLLLYNGVIAHPLKLSMTKIMLAKNEGSTKIFADDLGICLEKSLKRIEKFESNQISKETEVQIIKFFASNFTIFINGVEKEVKVLKIHVNEEESLDTKMIEISYTILDMPKQNKIKEIKIMNTLLFNAIPEQKNVLSISSEIYETKQMLFENSKSTTTHIIKY